jgi:hypothetical protein
MKEFFWRCNSSHVGCYIGMVDDDGNLLILGWVSDGEFGGGSRIFSKVPTKIGINIHNFGGAK